MQRETQNSLKVAFELTHISLHSLQPGALITLRLINTAIKKIGRSCRLKLRRHTTPKHSEALNALFTKIKYVQFVIVWLRAPSTCRHASSLGDYVVIGWAWWRRRGYFASRWWREESKPTWALWAGFIPLFTLLETEKENCAFERKKTLACSWRILGTFTFCLWAFSFTWHLV